jgi:outer membrane PBP1 activator LpoA protein
VTAVPRCQLRRAGAVLVLATLMAGCAGSTPAVSGPASAALTADVSRLQAAATQGTATDVEAAAAAVRQEVATQVTTGSLSSDRAASILDQLSRVLADASVRPAPPATPSAPPSDQKKRDHSKGDGGGEGD